MADDSSRLQRERSDFIQIGSTRGTILAWVRQCENSDAIGGVARKEFRLVGLIATMLTREKDNAANLRRTITTNEHAIA